MTPTPETRLLNAIARTADLTRGRARAGRTHDDADDMEGTIASDDAIGFNPLPLLRALDASGARAVIIGQVAGILHGSVELTGDLDLLWSGSADEAAALSQAFGSVDAELWSDDGQRVNDLSAAFALPKVEFRTAESAGDCCTPALPWGELHVASFLDRADVADVDGVRLHYLALDDLIAMRLAVGRPKDLRRAAELQAP